MTKYTKFGISAQCQIHVKIISFSQRGVHFCSHIIIHVIVYDYVWEVTCTLCKYQHGQQQGGPAADSGKYHPHYSIKPLQKQEIESTHVYSALAIKKQRNNCHNETQHTARVHCY